MTNSMLEMGVALWNAACYEGRCPGCEAPVEYEVMDVPDEVMADMGEVVGREPDSTGLLRMRCRPDCSRTSLLALGQQVADDPARYGYRWFPAFKRWGKEGSAVIALLEKARG